MINGTLQRLYADICLPYFGVADSRFGDDCQLGCVGQTRFRRAVDYPIRSRFTRTFGYFIVSEGKGEENRSGVRIGSFGSSTHSPNGSDWRWS